MDVPESKIPPDRKRRSGIRHRPRGTAEVRVGAAGTSPNIAVALIDISESGALLEVRQAVEPGRRLLIRLIGQGELAGDEFLAQAVRCRPADEGRFLLGVRFENHLSFEQLNRVSVLT